MAILEGVAGLPLADDEVQLAQAVLAATKALLVADTSQHGPQSKARFMYWKKGEQTDEPGYVCWAPCSPHEFQKNIRRGMIPLVRYGEFTDVDKERGWNLYTNPFKGLFDAGAFAEFPVQQVLEHGWHRTPPVPGARFPQLEGVEIGAFPCTYCRKVFLTQANLEAHEAIRHKGSSEPAKLARHMAEANTGVLAPILAAIQEQQRLAAERQASTEERLAKALEALAQLAGGALPLVAHK